MADDDDAFSIHSRLSAVNLKGWSDNLTGLIAEAAQRQFYYQSQIAGALQRRQELESIRLQLEMQLEQNRADLETTGLALAQAEAGEAEASERLRVLREVDAEALAIKQRALEDLTATMGRIPARGQALLAPGSAYLLPRPLAPPDPAVEEALAQDLKKALVRGPDASQDDGAADDMDAVRRDIRAYIRGTPLATTSSLPL